jgi:hypothetical protein
MFASIWVKLAGVAVILAALWLGYEHVKQIGYNQAKAEMQEENLKLALAYADRIVKAEGERDANQTIIDRLASQRVQVHFPVCPATGTANQDGTAGVLFERMDESFAKFQDGVGALLKRCDELNLDAIKVNAVLK